MSLVIKKHSHTRGSTAKIFRGIAKLPDGKFAVLTFNTNITAKSGSSSEHNNIAKLYITVYNTDWSTYTSSSVAVVSAAKSKHTLGQLATMAIDSSGNIHIVYNYRSNPDNPTLASQGQVLKYRKITYDGTTLSTGSEISVYSTAGYYTGIDIDVPMGTTLNDGAVIAFTHTTNGSTMITRLFQRTGGQVTQIESVTSAPRGVTLALNNTNDNASYKWLAATYQMQAGNDVGDTIIYGSGTTTTAPVITNTLASNLNVGLGSGMRHLAAFRIGNVIVVTGPVAAKPFTHFFAAYTVPVGSAASITQSPTNLNVGGNYVANANYTFATMQLKPDTNSIICHISDGKNIYAQRFSYVIPVDESTFTVTAETIKWKMDQWYLSKNVAPALLYNGDRARGGSVDIKVIADCPEAYLYILYRRVPTGGTIVVTRSVPATNGLTNVSNPKLTFTVTGNANNNIVGYVQCQVATDANFLTGVQYFNSGMQTFLKSLTVNVQVPEGALPQGLYYARARIVDQVRNTYGWNPTQAFTVSHKPTAIVNSPARGAVAIYNLDDTVTFNIGFSDPDKTDTMSAYRISVETVAGTVVADTGKVASTSGVVNVAVPSISVDSDMIVNAWVWDSDDRISDAASSDFFLATLPELAIDFPIEATPVTTATPSYSWENTIPINRTQVSYRVVVRNTDKGTIVWDSKVLYGDGDIVVQPAGYLKNGVNHSVTVSMTDNLGMTAHDVVNFPTEWIKPPSCPAPIVDLGLWNSLGFAYITIIPPTVATEDIPNTQLALMRRSLFSNSEWELIDSIQMGSGLNYSIIDSTLPSGVDSYYATVLQVDIGGDISTGNPDESTPAKVISPWGNYWLVSQDNPQKNTVLNIVNGDSYTEEIEQEVMVIANRGRWVDVGEDIGKNGTLTVKIYDKDAGLGGKPIMNHLTNPRLEASGVGPSGIYDWILTGANYLTRKTYSPCPVGKANCVAIGKTGGGNAVISQTVSAESKSYMLSAWLETSYIAVAAGKSVILTAICKDSLDATIGTFTLTSALNVSGTHLELDNAQIFQSIIDEDFNWYRLNKAFAAPVGTVAIVVSISLVGSGGDYLTIGGAILIDSIDENVNFFDGYSQGCEWMGDPVNSRSFTTGKITARAARRRIMNFVTDKEVFYLRNPFGDVFKVAGGAIQVDRIAGTGQNEFVSISIPYLEVK